MTEEEKEELLITMDVKLDRLLLDFENHLKDHKKYMWYAWTTAIGVIIALVALIIGK